MNESYEPRIVLVGNGPSVLDYEAGAMIDGFDEIYRFNNYDTSDEFAKHVGTRTTGWICNDYVPFDVNGGDAQIVRCALPTNEHRYGHEVPVILRKMAGMTWPSTALCVAQHFVKSEIRVWIHGMDAYERTQRNYWSTDSVPKNDLHDQEKEAQCWETWVTDGTIYLLETQAAMLKS